MQNSDLRRGRIRDFPVTSEEYLLAMLMAKYDATLSKNYCLKPTWSIG